MKCPGLLCKKTPWDKCTYCDGSGETTYRKVKIDTWNLLKDFKFKEKYPRKETVRLYKLWMEERVDKSLIPRLKSAPMRATRLHAVGSKTL